MPRLRTLLAATIALVALASCSSCKSGTKSTDGLPAGGELLRSSATAMRDIKTARFLITADGTIAGLPLKRAEGVLTREGSAQGTAQVEQLGTTVELAFVIVGETIHLKGPTGGYQELPLALASAVYDPSAILDPDRGVAKVLGTATDAKTEGEETVEGQKAYRVAAKFPAADLATVVPGVTGAVPGKVWIASDNKRLLKAMFELPAVGDAKGGSVTVTFKEFDAPVSISAP